MKGMYDKIFSDPELQDYFSKSNKDLLLAKQVEFLTYATGGSSQWTGLSMKEAHQGRGIGDREFKKVGDIIRETLENLGVTQDLIAEVNNLLGSLRAEIAIL